MLDLEDVREAFDRRSIEVRFGAAERIRETIDDLRDVLCARLSEERNELVLVSILETLQILDIDDEVSCVIARMAATDRRPLVRAYAILALSKQSTFERESFFLLQLLSENNPRVRIEILLALYAAGEKHRIEEIIHVMMTSEYVTQCAAINGLLEFDLDEVLGRVLGALNQLLESDAPLAVTSTAQKALAILAPDPSSVPL